MATKRVTNCMNTLRVRPPARGTVAATYPQELARVRALAPTLPLLIPGIGAQGGDAQATVRAAWRPDAPIIVSSSRAVLYALGDAPHMQAAAAAARAVARATRDQLQAARPLPEPLRAGA